MTSRLALKAYLRAITATGRPIVLGPWRSEVGFESLYWLAFLRWAKTYAGFKAARCLAITRGGAGVLYPHMATADLYQLRSIEAVRQENHYDAQYNGGIQKQTRVTEWDRDVVHEAVRQQFGRGTRYHLLHPAWMYQLLEPWWAQTRGLVHLESMTEYQPLARPTYDGLTLPPEFIAVKWYARSTFQPSEPVKQLVSQVTGTIAAQIPVVLLNTGHGGDEHADITVTGPNIHTLPATAPHRQLELQLAVIGRAKAYVGTYGGLAQTALRMGVPALTYYEKWGGTALAHLWLSDYLAKRSNTNFQVGNLSDLALWRTALMAPAPVAPQAPPPPQLAGAPA